MALNLQPKEGKDEENRENKIRKTNDSAPTTSSISQSLVNVIKEEKEKEKAKAKEEEPSTSLTAFSGTGHRLDEVAEPMEVERMDVGTPEPSMVEDDEDIGELHIVS